MACQPENIQVLKLVQEEGDEEISDVVRPIKEQLVEELLENFLNDLSSLLDRNVMKSPIEQVKSSRGRERVLHLEGNLETLDEKVKVEIGRELETLLFKLIKPPGYEAHGRAKGGGIVNICFGENNCHHYSEELWVLD